MIKLFSPLDYTIPLILNFISNGMTFVVVMSIWLFLKYLELKSSSSDNRLYGGISIVAVMGIASVLKVISHHHYKNQVLLMAVKLKAAVIGMVHMKILHSNRCHLAGFTTGQIMNYVSNDAKRIDELWLSAVETLSIPFILVAVILSLILLVGWQSLCGLLLIGLLSICIAYPAKAFAKIRKTQALVTDERLAVMNEIIRGIRAVKMYAWEWKYNDLIGQLRSKEVNLIARKSLIQCVVLSFQYTIAPMASLISICCFLYFDIHVDAMILFTMTMIYAISIEPLSNKLGYHFLNLKDVKVSIDRIEEFLCCSQSSGEKRATVEDTSMAAFKANTEINDQQQSTSAFKNQKKQDTPLVILEEISATWKTPLPSVLHQISLKVTSCELLMVTGPVGSGKSSLLMAILGEIPTTDGAIQTHGRIAYVTQTPWIFSGTVRDNILFGKPLDISRYNRILEICDLNKDTESFPNGDLSLVGQRGIALSGGQRARVSLTRAVYSDADIYLLDDPLSAVDTRVGQHIFDKCICGELSSRIRILVTHQVQHLQRADTVVVLEEGFVVAQGSPSRLKKESRLQKIGELYNLSFDNTEPSVGHSSIKKKLDGKDVQEEDEDRAVGIISWQLYWQFFRIGLPAVLIGCLILLYFAVEASVILPSWWMSRIAYMSLQKQRRFFALGILAGLSAITIVLSALRVFSIVYAISQSTRKLIHHKMTAAVIKSPILFFDTNPAGRIINRFSKDIGAVDDFLPMQCFSAISIFLNLFGVVVLACLVKFWIMLAIIPLGILFFYITQFYLRNSRELKRIEAIRCSPVYEHIAEALAGLEIIRASNMEDNSCEEMFRNQDDYTQVFFLVQTCNRWSGLYIELLCPLFLTASAVVGLMAIEDNALAGMLLTAIMALSNTIPYGIRMAADLESQMTSIERVMTYMKLPSEPAYSRQDKPPEDWPNQGTPSIRDMSMVYLEGGTTVLSHINIDVQPKEKVGIVGRTGAGKSSLVAALFRMPDPQGQVLIDGVDLGTIDIQAVRRSMAVITQDPVLFAGSLKKNLDPFDRFTDEDIWLVLEQVQLKNKMEKLPHQLEYCVGEGGSGFSVGERQLLCLARALLQKCKIIVLDEATANVDYKTDQLIQQVIRQQFTNCTVLTIAHRLNTIMDYDKVVVLDQGHVMEYDNPRVLAGKENGIFARFCKKMEA